MMHLIWCKSSLPYLNFGVLLILECTQKKPYFINQERAFTILPCFQQRLEVGGVGRILQPHCLMFGNLNNRKNYGCYLALRICLILCFVLVILAIIMWFLYSPSQKTEPSQTSKLLPLQGYFRFILFY